jgi:hypothetical protein
MRKRSLVTTATKRNPLGAFDRFLEHANVASAVFVIYAAVGGVCTILGSLSNGEYVESLRDVGIATGAIGAARALRRIG